MYGANGICGYTDSPGINGDAILIVKDGSGVGNVSYAIGEYSVIGTSNYLTAKNGYSLRYLYYSLMKFNFAPYKTGMAIPHIYFKDYGKAKIYCPSLEEQERIASNLSKIERKIEIERSIKDNCIMQKILPRIQGSSASIKEMLCQLFELLSGQKIDANASDSSTAAAMQKILDGGTAKYPKSVAKIKFMVQRFEEDGFTSYWL